MSEPKTSWRIDTSALKQSRDYRLIYSAGSISLLGSMITYVTLPLQIALLTGSYVAVGIIGVIEIVPLIIFGIWGGAIADTANRKRTLIWCEIALGLCTMVLLWNSTLAAPHLWVLYVIALFFAVFDGLQRPSLDALLPQIVPVDKLRSAAALNSLRWNIGSIAGPAIGGLLAATLGATTAYACDVATYVISVLLVIRLSSVTTKKSGEKISVKLLFSGYTYARNRADLLGTYMIDIVAMVFAFPNALFPFMAKEYGAPWALGLLYAAMSVGSLIATVTSGWTARVHLHGRAIVFAACTWGFAMALAGVTANIYFALLALLVAGAADMVSGLFRQLIWNTTIPLEMRGRLSGIEMLSYSIGPQLGQIRSTVAARAFGLRVSLISGGIFCVVGAASLSVALKALWAFDNQTNEFAVHERKIRGNLEN